MVNVELLGVLPNANFANCTLLVVPNCKLVLAPEADVEPVPPRLTTKVPEFILSAFKFVNPEPLPEISVAVIVPSTVKFPLKLPSPFTSSFFDGFMVPIPTCLLVPSCFNVNKLSKFIGTSALTTGFNSKCINAVPLVLSTLHSIRPAFPFLSGILLTWLNAKLALPPLSLIVNPIDAEPLLSFTIILFPSNFNELLFKIVSPEPFIYGTALIALLIPDVYKSFAFPAVKSSAVPVKFEPSPYKFPLKLTSPSSFIIILCEPSVSKVMDPPDELTITFELPFSILF